MSRTLRGRSLENEIMAPILPRASSGQTQPPPGEKPSRFERARIRAQTKYQIGALGRDVEALLKEKKLVLASDLTDAQIEHLTQTFPEFANLRERIEASHVDQKSNTGSELSCMAFEMNDEGSFTGKSGTFSRTLTTNGRPNAVRAADYTVCFDNVTYEAATNEEAVRASLPKTHEDTCDESLQGPIKTTVKIAGENGEADRVLENTKSIAPVGAALLQQITVTEKAPVDSKIQPHVDAPSSKMVPDPSCEVTPPVTTNEPPSQNRTDNPAAPEIPSETIVETAPTPPENPSKCAREVPKPPENPSKRARELPKPPEDPRKRNCEPETSSLQEEPPAGVFFGPEDVSPQKPVELAPPPADWFPGFQLPERGPLNEETPCAEPETPAEQKPEMPSRWRNPFQHRAEKRRRKKVTKTNKNDREAKEKGPDEARKLDRRLNHSEIAKSDSKKPPRIIGRIVRSVMPVTLTAGTITGAGAGLIVDANRHTGDVKPGQLTLDWGRPGALAEKEVRERLGDEAPGHRFERGIALGLCGWSEESREKLFESAKTPEGYEALTTTLTYANIEYLNNHVLGVVETHLTELETNWTSDKLQTDGDMDDLNHTLKPILEDAAKVVFEKMREQGVLLPDGFEQAYTERLVKAFNSNYYYDYPLQAANRDRANGTGSEELNGYFEASNQELLEKVEKKIAEVPLQYSLLQAALGQRDLTQEDMVHLKSWFETQNLGTVDELALEGLFETNPFVENTTAELEEAAKKLNSLLDGLDPAQRELIEDINANIDLNAEELGDLIIDALSDAQRTIQTADKASNNYEAQVRELLTTRLREKLVNADVSDAAINAFADFTLQVATSSITPTASTSATAAGQQRVDDAMRALQDSVRRSLEKANVPAPLIDEAVQSIVLPPSVQDSLKAGTMQFSDLTQPQVLDPIIRPAIEAALVNAQKAAVDETIAAAAALVKEALPFNAIDDLLKSSDEVLGQYRQNVQRAFDMMQLTLAGATENFSDAVSEKLAGVPRLKLTTEQWHQLKILGQLNAAVLASEALNVPADHLAWYIGIGTDFAVCVLGIATALVHLSKKNARKLRDYALVEKEIQKLERQLFNLKAMAAVAGKSWLFESVMNTAKLWEEKVAADDANDAFELHDEIAELDFLIEHFSRLISDQEMTASCVVVDGKLFGSKVETTNESGEVASCFVQAPPPDLEFDVQPTK